MRCNVNAHIIYVRLVNDITAAVSHMDTTGIIQIGRSCVIDNNRSIPFHGRLAVFTGNIHTVINAADTVYTSVQRHIPAFSNLNPVISCSNGISLRRQSDGAATFMMNAVIARSNNITHTSRYGNLTLTSSSCADPIIIDSKFIRLCHNKWLIFVLTRNSV